MYSLRDILKLFMDSFTNVRQKTDGNLLYFWLQPNDWALNQFLRGTYRYEILSLSKIRTYEQTGKIQFLDLVRIVKAIGEKESIFDFLDFDKKTESEIELDAIIKYETNGKRQRASNKKKV